jgi:hypothetical protein
MIKRSFLRAVSVTLAACVLGWQALGSEVKLNEIHKGPFGSCCKDLSDAMTKPPNKFIFVETNNVLYLTIGYVQTEKGPGWFDQAVIYCPFCGKQIQSREEIARKAHG